jgi:Uma2 family endonuclease
MLPRSKEESRMEQANMSVQVARRYFNVTEFYRMAAAGVFSEDDRVELIEGEILEMSPIGSRHAACVGRLTELFSQQAGSRAIVWVQNPIRLNDYSEPLPDIALLKRRADFYAEHHPTPADVFLIVEVADTSIDYDRNIKLPIYAQANIPEVWLVNLSKNIVEIYTQPANDKYQKSRRLKRGELLVSPQVSNLSIGVSEILG